MNNNINIWQVDTEILRCIEFDFTDDEIFDQLVDKGYINEKYDLSYYEGMINHIQVVRESGGKY